MKTNEIQRRKAIAADNIARIRQEVAAKVKVAESDWQLQAGRWLSLGRKKVQVKQKEDQEAKQGKKKRQGKTE